MTETTRRKAVYDILQGLDSVDGLKRLFWEELNYDRENAPLSTRDWPEETRDAFAGGPVLLASGAPDGAFHVIHCPLESKERRRTTERLVVNRMLPDHPYALFVFSDPDCKRWHFVNVKYGPEGTKRRLFRRITVEPGAVSRTAAERLQMLDLEALAEPTALAIQERHDEAFDVEQVTREFYRELANWYFWAVENITFPKDAPKDGDRDHVSVIRLITRLVFCWFMKEKGLIPPPFFNERELSTLLNGFAPEGGSMDGSVYYRAILQNLFFATLNTEMPERDWARDAQNFMAHTRYRYKDCFADPGKALAEFQQIPFLNGGLFECLDRDRGKDANPRYVRVDGFSRRPDSQPVVPDVLFFGRERKVDLSRYLEGRTGRAATVRGLIPLLERYRFTIEENTPFDHEVALDPELAGKIFENLLAAYNPETGATARKATGSYYTPREVVDYMVDEALIALLADEADASGQSGDAEMRLRRLLSWEETGHDFSEDETEALISRIDTLKALDPAVGSGAFSMGLLHKLVHALSKLDPGNERWKRRQIDQLEAAEMRAEAEKAFQGRYDYSRKLYLIEKCLYGVDIQPSPCRSPRCVSSSLCLSTRPWTSRPRTAACAPCPTWKPSLSPPIRSRTSSGRAKPNCGVSRLLKKKRNSAGSASGTSTQKRLKPKRNTANRTSGCARKSPNS